MNPLLIGIIILVIIIIIAIVVYVMNPTLFSTTADKPADKPTDKPADKPADKSTVVTPVTVAASSTAVAALVDVASTVPIPATHSEITKLAIVDDRVAVAKAVAAAAEAKERSEAKERARFEAALNSAIGAAITSMPDQVVPPSLQTIYNGNNGSVNGSRYCSGNWESTGGEKNMTCTTGRNTTTGATLDCGITYGVGGPYSYTCSPTPTDYKTYKGNNGTVSGATYCKGNWESSTGNKNLNCLYGKNDTTGAALDCDNVYGGGNAYTYTCAP